MFNNYYCDVELYVNIYKDFFWNMQQFFIDHTNKKTSYMDPRVPTEPMFPRRTSDDNSGVSGAWFLFNLLINMNLFAILYLRKCM